MEINQKTELREALIQTSNFGELPEKILYRGYRFAIELSRLKSLIKATNLPFLVKIEIDEKVLKNIEKDNIEFYKAIEKDIFDDNATKEERNIYIKAYKDESWG
ncbi:hypothetical protein ABF179_002324 [Flavobacterium psychrophilum]